MGIRTDQWHVTVPRKYLSEASRILRDWAVAHAGTYHSQASKQIKQGANTQWERNGVSIVIRSLSNAVLPDLQVVRASIKNEDGESDVTSYVAHAISWRAGLRPEEAHIIAVGTDLWSEQEKPWGGNAGLKALTQRMREIQEKGGIRTGGKRKTAHGREALDEANLGEAGELVMLLPWLDEDEPCAQMNEVAGEFGHHYNTVILDHAAARAVGRQIEEPDEAVKWNRASFALYQRDIPGRDGRITYMTDDADAARTTMREALNLRQAVEQQAATQAMCNLTELTAALAGNAIVRVPGSLAEAPVADRQRVDTLEDQLRDARQEADRLRERISQKDNELEAAYSALRGNDDEEEDEAPRALRAGVEKLIAEDERFPRLRFLKGATKPLGKHRQPNPTVDELTGALDAINGLASAWHNTPNRQIGSWAQYFNKLTGWHYSPDESEQTKTKHGIERRFQDDATGEPRDVYRHLTYHARNSSFQIYFDLDEARSEWIVAYMGRHLTYATET